MKRRRLLLLGAGLAVAAPVTYIGVAVARRPDETGPAPELATAPVVRGDLSDVRTLRGTLDHGPVEPLECQATGIVTELTPVGATVERGGVLFRVDDLPVVVLYGAVPMWRELHGGITGRDVTQLQENLTALGHGKLTADGSFTRSTGLAVRRWQKSLGLQETGTVPLGQVAFRPAAVRIADHRVRQGARASGPVVGVTGTARMATVPVQPADKALVKAGVGVSVLFNGGGSVAGTVTGVTQAAEQLSATVSLAEQAAAAKATDPAVQVQIVVAKRTGVLSVPVTALLALADGGYGVELVDGQDTSIVKVETGLFTQGRVEISGAGIEAGDLVKVPAA
ncbi:peptidoglycan-binding protein [Dactylosporangium fulvum]|uniref:Peptidoglycan-binding protein n=1 Tax=Dactylosporangium fulvum TaxID=53359 RepID=A0ABY5W9B7_9ACTN|nr:peptidoglycan-binding domain-containing protein [Dactylosporangium fulvum]UWP85604.1 peptidoglycan-binding protein [Dactylosporangium fulvum]